MNSKLQIIKNWERMKDDIIFQCYEEDVTDLLNNMIDDINELKLMLKEKETITSSKVFSKYLDKNLDLVYTRDTINTLAFLFEDYDKAKPI